jgi:hypothetical protein
LNKSHLYIALILSGLGLGLFLYKVLALGFPVVKETKASIWYVETHVTFEADGGPVKVVMNIPGNQATLRVSDESFVSPGYGLTIKEEGVDRQAIWSVREAYGEQSLYYRGVVRRLPAKDLPKFEEAPSVIPHGFDGAELVAAKAILKEAKSRSADLESMVQQLIKIINRPKPDELVAPLLKADASVRDKALLMVRILALEGIPARLRHGVKLEDTREAILIERFQVFEKGRWACYDPITAEKKSLPGQECLFLWRGESPQVTVDGGHNVRASTAVRATLEQAVENAINRGRTSNPLLIKFSLFSLPVRVQQVYEVILLVPVGAFLIVILRNLVGIRTSGVFMPVLIALAFRETKISWGIILFVSMVLLGLAVRFLLDRLKLLLVPRLTVVLLSVIGFMVAISILTNHLGLERGVSVALFPMVILTMTIERFCIIWEESGPAETLYRGVASLAAATCAYLVMSWHPMGYLVFVFPELLLVIMAFTLLIGRYSGYRVSDLVRFKAISEKQR